jgi:predicted PolB exonuclease-like 3'-5' exonuclease
MNQMSNEIKYLVFDVESVADGRTIQRSRYPYENLSPEDAIRKFRYELLRDGGKDFIPYTYHIPVAVVIAKVREDYSLVEIVSLDEPQHRPEVITKHFWTGWERYARPSWVTFNGRSFDIPLMELAAYRYQVSIPSWYNIFDKAYEQNRNRFNVHSHLDLHEVLTNFGSSWFRGGLNLAAQLAGKPGKIDVQGAMVHELYAEGRLSEISEYCRCDVLDTYFTFLRCLVIMGKITAERERELAEIARGHLQQNKDQHPAYAAYLEQWEAITEH